MALPDWLSRAYLGRAGQVTRPGRPLWRVGPRPAPATIPAHRERTVPVTSPALVPALRLAAHAENQLTDACGKDPGIACRLTWNVTHSQTAAQLVNVWLARPVTLILQIILVV